MIEDLQSARFSKKLVGVGRRLAGVFVLEIDVNIHALAEPGIKSLLPSRDLLRSVVFQAQSCVSPTGGEHFGRRLLIGLGQDERRLVLAKNVVSFLGVPRRVTHFKCKLERRRPKSQEILQQGAIEFEVRRQLNEDWAQVVAVV